MRHGALIYNPAAGRRRATRQRDEICAVLAAAGWQIEAAPTRAPGDATELAGALARAGRVEAVFTVGGDGTLREVAAGLLGSEVALAPLPGGTTNVLARVFGIPRRPVAAARALAVGTSRPLAVGLCGRTPFLMMVSAGLDADIMGSLSGDLKARLGMGAVGLQGLGSWWRYGFPAVTARWDGQQAEGSFAAVCNIPLYAGSFALAPAAIYDDDLLDLVLWRRGGRLRTLAFTADLVLGRHLRRRDVVSASAPEIELLGPPELPLQVDGDPCREALPVRVRVAPERLRVMVPAP
jgi:diacylglycerol kinase (ATP)